MNEHTLPPCDLIAEQALIGLVLADSTCDFDACARLKPDAMYSEAHRRTWKALMEIVATGSVPDMVQLRARLKRNGDQGVVDEDVLRSFAPHEAGFSFGRAQEYIQIVHEHAKSRALIRALQESLAIGYAGSLDAETFIRDTQGRVEAAAKLDASEFTPRFLDEVIKEELAKIKAANGEDRPIAVSGLDGLDKVLSVCEGQLVVIGARPGMGKSALAEHYATATGDALFCSLEMPSGELGRRAMTHKSGVPFVRSIARPAEYGPRFAQAFDSLRKQNVMIVDKPSITLAELRSFVRHTRHELLAKGRSLKLVVVDYLQLMTAPTGRRESNRSQELGSLTKALKEMAKREKIAVVLLAQLSREAEKAERPTMAHLRESGDIEQDADKVLLLYRKAYYENNGNGKDVEEAEVIVAKNRQGSPGIARVGWRGEVTSFVDLE